MAINPQARTPGYEKADANPRGLLYFVIVMACILAPHFSIIARALRLFSESPESRVLRRSALCWYAASATAAAHSAEPGR